MIVLQGIGVSKGVKKGPICFVGSGMADVPRYRVKDSDAEWSRIAEAQEQSIGQLTDLAKNCRMEAQEEAAALFEGHLLLVKDPYFEQAVKGCLEETLCNAEFAVWEAGEQFAAMFEAMEDSYMKARAADIRDVASGICRNLLGKDQQSCEKKKPVILAADDLMPSEIMGLDRKQILGFMTRKGNTNSHVAILARSLGIPAVCGLGNALTADYQEKNVYIDGETGCVYLEPDEKTDRFLSKKQEEEQERKETYRSMRGKDAVTPEGKKICIYCNIGSPADVEAVLENDGQGIGLFRSEYLYLATGECPGEEEQFLAYREVLRAMEGKPVTIRTLDVGGDKRASYLNIPDEENPALGMRGIRLCLERPELFRKQLKALYRASACGNLSILLPMITSAWEVEECKRLCREVMEELNVEGISYREDVKIGIMIETPAAVLMAGELAKTADFFSIGTNDLTQYLLACDRQSGSLEKYNDSHHPAVLRAIRLTVDAAKAAGIPIGICGELAADEELLPAFLEMGIDELSVAPGEVLPLRARVRAL